MTNYDRLKIGVYGLGILLTVIEVVEKIPSQKVCLNYKDNHLNN